MMSSPSRQYISKLCNLTAFQDQNVITFEANETKPTKFYLGKVVDVLLFMVCIALRNFFHIFDDIQRLDPQSVWPRNGPVH